MLTWENIISCMLMTILHGPEFQIYLVVALLQHLEPCLREMTSRNKTFQDLMGLKMADFALSDWKTFICRLQEKYQGLLKEQSWDFRARNIDEMLR